MDRIIEEGARAKRRALVKPTRCKRILNLGPTPQISSTGIPLSTSSCPAETSKQPVFFFLARRLANFANVLVFPSPIEIGIPVQRPTVLRIR